jgi:hypothetical protein
LDQIEPPENRVETAESSVRKSAAGAPVGVIRRKSGGLSGWMQPFRVIGAAGVRRSSCFDLGGYADVEGAIT